jgi:ATP-dependent helicase/DNAse subunit B
VALELIVGPPHSNRAGEVLARLRSALDRDPLLVVPTGDDIVRFERELCEGGAPQVGVTIRTFGSLFDEIAGITATPVPPRLSPPQRLALVRAATASAELRVLRRSSESPGFAPALDTLIAELQAALVPPAALLAAAEASEGDSAQELELARLYEEYERLRNGAGRSDSGSVAAAAVSALRADPAAWGEMPVFIYGFDDLTEVQLDLIGVLAEACDVVFAVNYSDRNALAARATLRTRLEEDGGSVVSELGYDPGYTSRPSLSHLAENIFENDPGTVDAFDGGLTLLSSAGERGEAEAVGIEIARLLTQGSSPDDIVVTLRRPSVEGPLFASVLHEMGIPATLEAHLPLGSTAVGRSLVALCRAASSEGEPADVLAHLRADTAFRQSRTDWAERAIARGTAESVAKLMEDWGETPPAHLKRVFEAGGAAERVRAVAVCARRIAEAVHRGEAPLAGERTLGVPLDPVELRAGVAAAELLSELAEVASLPGMEAPDLADAADAIESATVRSWQGSAEGRVRILSPYRVRAGRVKHLFCCALQEGSFPGRGAADPLLGDESRGRLGIPALRRTEQDAEERYLFGVCVSRPTESLTLSWRSSDDEGHPAARSPFVDEVIDLLDGDAEAVEEALTTERGLANPVPRPSDATTPRALARALTASLKLDVEAHRARLDAMGADFSVAGPVLDLVGGVSSPEYKPKGLHHPAVLEAIRSRTALSAGSLEGWIECSYRWFVNHELSPRRLEPTADPLWLGGLVHTALEKLYAEPPGSDGIPRPADLEKWQAQFRELLDELVAEGADGGLNAERSIAIARVKIQVEKFLEDESKLEIAFRPRPDLLERSFGFEEEHDDDPGALDFGDFKLRGFIDRIDVAPDGRSAIVRDYKTSKEVPGRRQIVDRGKLQLPLYMLVARDLLNLDPIAGLYHPLAAYDKRSGRGYGLKDETGEGGLLEHAGVDVGTDKVNRDDLDEALSAARERAKENGLRMLAGDIDRDPLKGKCNKYCEYQPICRLERAIGLEDEGENGGSE